MVKPLVASPRPIGLGQNKSIHALFLHEMILVKSLAASPRWPLASDSIRLYRHYFSLFMR